GYNISPDDVEAIIQGTATDLPDDPTDSPDAGANWDNHGRVNFQAAVQAVGVMRFNTGYITDPVNNLVRVMDPDNLGIGYFVPAGVSGLSAPFVTRQGRLLVSSSNTNEIYMFDASGNTTRVADASDGLSTPYGPNAIAQDRAGFIYVGNSGKI